jgi:hypothetical protein
LRTRGSCCIIPGDGANRLVVAGGSDARNFGHDMAIARTRQTVGWRGIMLRFFAVAAVLVPSFLASEAWADCDLDGLVGYTLLAQKYIAGRIDKGIRNDDFEGCDFGRVIVFDDNTGVQCMTYSYTYSYHPRAYVFGNGNSMKMCVGSSMYAVGPIR